ncbi:hypothetical protein SMICM17S_03914 [Streptomyces microflavus]
MPPAMTASYTSSVPSHAADIAPRLQRASTRRQAPRLEAGQDARRGERERAAGGPRPPHRRGIVESR